MNIFIIFNRALTSDMLFDAFVMT